MFLDWLRSVLLEKPTQTHWLPCPGEKFSKMVVVLLNQSLTQNILNHTLIQKHQNTSARCFLHVFKHAWRRFSCRFSLQKINERRLQFFDEILTSNAQIAAASWHCFSFPSVSIYIWRFRWDSFLFSSNISDHSLFLVINFILFPEILFHSISNSGRACHQRYERSCVI